MNEYDSNRILDLFKKIVTHAQKIYLKQIVMY